MKFLNSIIDQVLAWAGTITINNTDAGNIVNFQSGGSSKATLSSAGDMTLTGTLSAVAKSFVIPHPTKEGMMLRHGSLEGPENGVYVRGRLAGDNKIILPEYWLGLVDPDTITVQLTSIRKEQDLFVIGQSQNQIAIGSRTTPLSRIDCYYLILGERKDIEKLEVEISNDQTE